MGRHWILVAVLFVAIGLVAACRGDQQPLPEAGQNGLPRAVATRELPTLYPSVTPMPTPSPANTRAPQPTPPPATAVSFDQLAAEVRYTIPILGLDRRIRGNVAGEIEVTDLKTRSSLTLKNRPGVIVEMQQSLPRATIQPLSSDCDTCVQVSYELPLTGESGEGWLNDVQMLASLENYTASALGPHFPPDTIIGLRREATPYEVAHSAAVTADGQLWAWTATEAEVDGPTSVEGVGQLAADSLAPIDWASLPPVIGQICYEGGGRELLYLESPDGPRVVDIRCPQLYLPSTLMTIYLILNEEVATPLSGGDIDPPILPMTLDSLVAFHRSDGATLTVSNSGQLSAMSSEGASFTSTVTTTLVLSLTSALLDSGLLQPGPSAIFDQEPGNVILLRGQDGVYEFAWKDEDEAPAGLIEPWIVLLESLLHGDSLEESTTPEPTPTATGDDGDS